MVAKTLVKWLEGYEERIHVLDDPYKSPEQKIGAMSPDQPYYIKIVNAVQSETDAKEIVSEKIREAIAEAKADLTRKAAFLRKKIAELAKDKAEMTKKYGGTELRELFKAEKIA